MKFTSKQVRAEIDVNWDNPKTRSTFRNSYKVNEMLDLLATLLLLMEFKPEGYLKVKEVNKID